ncbi:phospholipase A and acyltransferase 3-like [Spea bombifrons]|uniref:phospholipase A and acyltransferase 3-like n=1 Tax=Spea bombifrons TaxID=233779 RepID=UPI00234A2158|nr:phospholipase A and acyltransferase 3-like [Spea bombifrons]
MPLVSGPPPKPGDLIEFIRPFYQHWGIYVGDGYVVHLTDQEGWSSLSSALGGTAVVRKDLIEDVAGGCDYRVNNKYDQKMIPYAPAEVVKAALQQVGLTMPYSVTSANCEHFATELRYGRRFSDQVVNATTYAAVGGVALASITAIFALVRNKRQNQ